MIHTGLGKWFKRGLRAARVLLQARWLEIM